MQSNGASYAQVLNPAGSASPASSARQVLVANIEHGQVAAVGHVAHPTTHGTSTSNNGTALHQPSSSSSRRTGGPGRKVSGPPTLVTRFMEQNEMYRGHDAEHPITTPIPDFLAPVVHYLGVKGVHFAVLPVLNEEQRIVL